MSASKREQMGQQILNMVAGEDAQDSFFAQADALATGIGGTAELSGLTLLEALDYFEGINGAMRAHIIENWGSIRGARE